MKKLLNEWRQYMLEAAEELEVRTPLEKAIREPKLRQKWNDSLASSGRVEYGVSPLGWERLKRLYKKGGITAIEQAGREPTTGLFLSLDKADKERWNSPAWEYSASAPPGKMAVIPAELMHHQVRRREEEAERTIEIEEPLKVRGMAPPPIKTPPPSLPPGSVPAGYEQGTRITVPGEEDEGVTVISPLRGEEPEE